MKNWCLILWSQSSEYGRCNFSTFTAIWLGNLPCMWWTWKISCISDKKSSNTTCHTLKSAKQNAANNLTPFWISVFNVLLNCILNFAHCVALVVPAALRSPQIINSKQQLNTAKSKSKTEYTIGKSSKNLSDNRC